MRIRITTLAVTTVLLATVAQAHAQYSSCPSKPITCPPYPETPVYPEVPVYPEQPVTNSYFLGVYVSTVQVDAYGSGGQPGGGGGQPVYQSQGRVGVRVAPGYGEDVYGQRINNVVPNSPAFHAGLEPGDIILDGNGYPMDSQNDLQHAINTSQGILEMKVLDRNTGRLMWVVAQTDPQNTSPVFAAQVRSRQQQASMKTASRGRNNNSFRTPPSNTRTRRTSNNGSMRTFTQQLSSGLRTLQTNGLGGRRAPIRRGQR